MNQIFSTSKVLYMALITVLMMMMISTTMTVSLSLEENHDRRSLFGRDKTNKIYADSGESPSGHGFSKWLEKFVSGDSKKEKQTDSFGKLGLLKTFLSSSSKSNTNDKSSKLNKLFQILGNGATDEKNESSSSSNKLNRLLNFFNNHGSSSSSSSNNFQLAKKLMNLAQGNGGLSSLSVSDMKSLSKYVG